MPVPGTTMFIALLAHIGGPLMGMHPHTPPSSMDITIADDNATVVGGQPLRYLITVHNPTQEQTSITVRVSLSPVSQLHADGGAAVANAAAWRSVLEPGSSRSYSIAAIVDPHGTDPNLAATACVHLATDTRAQTCATDLNTIAAGTPRERGFAWLAAILLGLLAVAGTILLERKIRPPLLTPDNAAYPPGPAGQPGGAPPV